jgi:hypothetical protein
VILHSSSFVILSVRFIFIIRLKRLFTNICNLFVIWLVVPQVSPAHNNIYSECAIVTIFDKSLFFLALHPIVVVFSQPGSGL